MTDDLISREAAIALLKSEFYEQCPKGSVQRLLFANAIEALTNTPSADLKTQAAKYMTPTVDVSGKWEKP